MNYDNNRAAEDLDAFLTARQAGRWALLPCNLSPEEVALSDTLVGLAEAIHPDHLFAARLEEQLRSHAKQRSNNQAHHKLPWSLLGHSPIVRRTRQLCLVLVLVGLLCLPDLWLQAALLSRYGEGIFWPAQPTSVASVGPTTMGSSGPQDVVRDNDWRVVPMIFVLPVRDDHRHPIYHMSVLPIRIDTWYMEQ